MYQDEKIEVHAMKTMEFKVWMKSFDHMSHSQLNKLRVRLQRESGIDEVTNIG